MYYADEVQVPHLPAFFRRTFGPFREVIWSVVVSWAIYTCVLGYAGCYIQHVSTPVKIVHSLSFPFIFLLASLNRFLSWRGFRPLARLTYCVYLIHTELIGFLLPAGFFGGDTITDWLLANAISMATSFGVAFFICLSIEIPFLNLERIVSSSLVSSTPLIRLRFNWNLIDVMRFVATCRLGDRRLEELSMYPVHFFIER